MNRYQAAAVRRTIAGDLGDTAIVVLTPVKAIHRRFRHHGWRETAEQGWWPQLFRESVRVLLIPQGSAVVDLGAGLAANPAVVFLGYAGSLTDRLAPGAIVGPSWSYAFGQESVRKRLAHGRDATVVSVPNLLTTYQNAHTLSRHADLADMETAHLACTLHRAGGPPLTARMLITDRWPDSPFYEPAPARNTLIRTRRNDLVDDFVITSLPEIISDLAS